MYTILTTVHEYGARSTVYLDHAAAINALLADTEWSMLKDEGYGCDADCAAGSWSTETKVTLQTALEKALDEQPDGFHFDGANCVVTIVTAT